jgi:hypothetical protein
MWRAMRFLARQLWRRFLEIAVKPRSYNWDWRPDSKSQASDWLKWRLFRFETGFQSQFYNLQLRARRLGDSDSPTIVFSKEQPLPRQRNRICSNFFRVRRYWYPTCYPRQENDVYIWHYLDMLCIFMSPVTVDQVHIVIAFSDRPSLKL